MKIYWDIEQRSTDWFLLRHGKIGGTLSGGLLVKSDTLLIQLVGERVEGFDEDSDEAYVNDAMQRGIDLEPEALKQLNKYTGREFLNAGWIQSEIPLLGISPDGITECGKFSAEIKCPGAKKHVATCMSGEIPADNMDQCIHYFTVNPTLEKHYFMSFRPEFHIKPIFVKELTLDSEINIGTKARPVLKTMREVVALKLGAAINIEAQIEETINNLNF